MLLNITLCIKKGDENEQKIEGIFFLKRLFKLNIYMLQTFVNFYKIGGNLVNYTMKKRIKRGCCIQIYALAFFFSLFSIFLQAQILSESKVSAIFLTALLNKTCAYFWLTEYWKNIYPCVLHLGLIFKDSDRDLSKGLDTKERSRARQDAIESKKDKKTLAMDVLKAKRKEKKEQQEKIVSVFFMLWFVYGIKRLYSITIHNTVHNLSHTYQVSFKPKKIKK